MLKVVVWNMAQSQDNWSYLQEAPELRGADIALLCEAPPYGKGVIAHGSTEGLEVGLASGKTVKRPWSTAVAAAGSPVEIMDARVDRYYGELLPFQPSRAGAWTAATVQVGDVEITAIALYGLMDERSDASVHRSLSELSPVFDHKRYGSRLLLGGDLNILAGRPVGEILDRHQVVLARIKAYGLIDCLEAALLRGKERREGLPNCPCGLGSSACMHTWTKRVKGSDVPYQDDYLFASPWLARRLRDCRALEFSEASDHAPIVATFDMPTLGYGGREASYDR